MRGAAGNGGPYRDSTTSQPPKPKRRWYQFSLKTLLVVMLVSTVVVGWIGGRVRQARVNRERVAAIEEAVVAIEEKGGAVSYTLASPTWLERQFQDPGDPGGFSTGVGFSRAKFTEADLQHLSAFTNLKRLTLSNVNVTDSGLKDLSEHTSLDYLILEYTGITDAGLEHLKGLTKLQHLVLFGTRVTDDGVKKLQQALPNCKIHY